MIDRWVSAWFALLRGMIALCLSLMVILVLGNVVLRYVFDSGLTLSEELSRWLFVWLVFLGAVVALHERAHLGVDTLVQRLAPRARWACLVVSHLLMLWATWLLLKGSWTQTLINLETTAPSSGLPVAIVYSVGIVYGVSSGLILLGDLWRLLRDPEAADAAGMVRESEELDLVTAATSLDTGKR